MSETALYRHTLAVYEYMHERAVLNKHEELLFTGMFGQTIKRSGASSRYYSSIRKLLISPDLDPCVVFRQKGNATQPSEIELRHPPPREWENITEKDLTGPRERATLVADIERDVLALKTWRESIGEVNLSEVLRDYELRITKLEQERGKRDG